MDYLTSEAVKISQQSCCHFKHGALVIKKGRIISSGYNDENNHAEVNALLKIQRLLREENKNPKDR
jgi:deoxycytidylate deaminase